VVVTATNGRIGFLGPLGTFTEQALRSQTDLVDDELVPMRTFVDVLSATQAGEIGRGFVAIENAIEGTVNVTLDTLAFDTTLLIQREVVLDIEMNLMAGPGIKLEDIREVASHPVANAQCRAFLNAKLPGITVRPANSTAEAAEDAAATPGTAALGPSIAGERYGLDIVAADIADMPENQTRFILVARSGVPAPTGHDKTTLVITSREEKPGSLVEILHEFSARNINLSKLTSRPARTRLGNYCFIIDMDGHIDDDVTANCLRNIRAKHADVKFLGSYPAAGEGSSQARSEASQAWRDAAEWMQSLRDQIVE
jgi:prephenate dehydratase